MEVTRINTILGWFNGDRSVTKYTTERFDNGQTVTKVEKRYYDVFLYSEVGKLEQYPTIGKNIDKLA